MHKGLYPDHVYEASLDFIKDERLLSCLREVEAEAQRKRASALLELFICVFDTDHTQLLSSRPHKHVRKAYKRLTSIPSCGVVGHLSYGYRVWVSPPDDSFSCPGDEVIPTVKFHPHSCRSIFCPHCWSKRVKQNSDRVRFFFEYLVSQGVSKANFITLTPPPHSGWHPELIEVVRKAWRRFLSFRITRSSLEKIFERVKEIAQEHLTELKKSGHPNAFNVVRKHLNWSRRWLKQHLGKTMSQALGYGMSVLEVVIKLLEDLIKDIHPHIHLVAVREVPLYVIKAVWEKVGGGSIVHAEVVSGLKALERYLRAYLSATEDETGEVSAGYLDIDLKGQKLTFEEALDLETYLWGVHFVNLFGIRYKRPSVSVERYGYVYRLEGFVYSRLAYIVARNSELGIVFMCYEGKYAIFYDMRPHLYSRASPLFELVRKHWLFQEGRSLSSGLSKKRKRVQEEDYYDVDISDLDF